MVLAVLLPARALAQGTDNDMETDFRGRLTVSADKKLMQGLHLGVDGEVRFTGDFGEIGRYQIGTGLTYKMLPWLIPMRLRSKPVSKCSTRASGM